jgi:penicillin amidase
MEQLQHDTLSIPARELVPLLRGVKTNDPGLQDAIKRLLAWDFVLGRDSTTAPIYEYWVLMLQPNAYRPRVPASARSSFRSYSIDRVIHWMKTPDAAYGIDVSSQLAARDQILLTSLKEGLAELKKKMGDDMDQWQWGKIHTADFVHPLTSYSAEARRLLGITPVPRGGDAFTVMASSSLSEGNTKQTSGASFMFVFDVQNWDRSTGLNTPGNSAQPLSPHYSDLAAEYWGDGKYFPLLFSRQKIDAKTRNRLVLKPEHAQTSSGRNPR